MKLLRRKKSFLLVFVVFVSFLLLFSQTAFAADGVKLSASTKSGIVGDEITVTINIDNALDTLGGQFDLTFDPEILEVVKRTKGDFVPDRPDEIGYMFGTSIIGDDTIRVLWTTIDEDGQGSEKASGEVCIIDFKIIESGTSELAFSGVVISGEDDLVVETPTDGKVTALTLEEALAAAIAAANAAIAALPDDITLDEKDDVAAARILVDYAMELGAEEDDFDDLAKLVAAEATIAMLNAIKAACDAINALPAVDELTLDHKPDVVAARALVNKAKDDHGVTEEVFNEYCVDGLKKLQALENRIRELEGLVPTPPTGGLNYLLFPGLFVIVVAMLLYTKRKRFAVR